MSKNKGIIGYVQLYIKITCKEETLYTMFNGDFGEPLTRRRLNSAKKYISSAYERAGLHVISSEFVTKEEYEKNTPKDRVYYTVDYDENSTRVTKGRKI